MILRYWRNSEGFHGRLKDRPEIQASGENLIKMVGAVRLAMQEAGEDATVEIQIEEVSQ
jgi:hypothetical protein